MGGWAVGWAHPRLGAEQSCSTEPRGARGRSSSRRSRCPASAAGSRRQGRPAGTAGDQSWGTRGSHPPWGPSTCRLPARPGRSPPAPRPRPPPPPPRGRPHLHGVGAVVQQRDVHALHAVCAAAVGAPEQAHFILPGVRGLSSTEPPSPGPQAPGLGGEVGTGGWGLGSLLRPPGGPGTSRMRMVVSVPGRMLKPWCSRKGVWSRL